MPPSGGDAYQPKLIAGRAAAFQRRRLRRRNRRLAVVAAAVGLVAISVGVPVGLSAQPRPPAQRPPETGAEIARGPAGSIRTAPISPPVPAVSAAAPVAQPNAAAPLRLLEVGDSLGIDLGEQLVEQLAGAPVKVTMASEGDTGLANAHFFDWPAHLSALLSRFRPQIVVVLLGANDYQGLYAQNTAAAPGTASWDTAYRQRIELMIDESTAAHARTVWVGMPAMASRALNDWMRHIDALLEAQVPLAPAALYLAPSSVLGSSDRYQAEGPGLSGQPAMLRTPDGVHLTAAGSAVLAHAVIAAIEQRWRLSLAPVPS